MITISGWLLLPIALASFAVGFSLCAWLSARSVERAIDRRLARELRRPLVNDQKASDRAERGQSDG